MADKQPTAAPPTRRRMFWLISIAVVLVLVVTGGVWALTRSSSSPFSGQSSLPLSSSSGVATSTATPTPTLRPAHVVYTANWSNGADGWSLPSSVHVKSGTLVFTGAGNVNLTIPYHAPVTGYSINLNMEIDTVNPAAHGGTITIAGEDATGRSQFYAQLLCVRLAGPGCRGGQFTVGIFGGKYPSGMQVSDFDVGPYDTPYQVRIGATNVQFCFQGGCESVGFVNIPKTPLTVVVQDDYLEMKVSSLSVSMP